MPEIKRELLVFGDTTFRVTIPSDAKVTFGPWSPPNSKGYRENSHGCAGTLRVYRGTKDNIVGCWSGVSGFRDLSLPYAEQVIVQKGDTIWHDDENGYVRQSGTQITKKWTNPQLPEPEIVSRKRKKSK